MVAGSEHRHSGTVPSGNPNQLCHSGTLTLNSTRARPLALALALALTHTGDRAARYGGGGGAAAPRPRPRATGGEGWEYSKESFRELQIHSV